MPKSLFLNCVIEFKTKSFPTLFSAGIVETNLGTRILNRLIPVTFGLVYRINTTSSTEVCYPCGCIKTFMPKSLSSFRLFCAEEGIWVFVLGDSKLELVSSMRLDGSKDIQSIKSDWSILI